MEKNLTETDKAYIAGVVDSDGSIGISRQNIKRPRPSYRPQFQLTWVKNQKTMQVLKFLKETYGGSICESKSMQGRFKNGQPIVKYMLATKQLKPFLLDILPYLRLKRKQAINTIRLISINNYCMQYGFHKPKPQRVEDIQNKLYTVTKRLNNAKQKNPSSY